MPPAAPSTATLRAGAAGAELLLAADDTARRARGIALLRKDMAMAGDRRWQRKVSTVGECELHKDRKEESTALRSVQSRA